MNQRYMNEKWIFTGLGAFFIAGMAFCGVALSGKIDGFHPAVFEQRAPMKPFEPQVIPNQKKQQITLVSKMAIGFGKNNGASGADSGILPMARLRDAVNKELFVLKLRHEFIKKSHEVG